MDFNKMLREANKMQREMQEAQAELESQEFDIDSCGGAIKVKITGSSQIKSISIAKEMIDPDDEEMLEDALVVAVNEAIKRVQAETEKITAKVTDGMSFPGF